MNLCVLSFNGMEQKKHVPNPNPHLVKVRNLKQMRIGLSIYLSLLSLTHTHLLVIIGKQ